MSEYSDSDSDSDSDDHEHSEEETDTFKYKVDKILKKVVNFGSGKFALSGELQQAPIIIISIKNGGRMHFPLEDDEIGNIIDSFEQSPYGIGTETVVDTTVRNSWQLNPEGFQIMNPNWDSFIKDVLLAHIKEEMSIETPFSASLYKLLMYKSGSFFKPHRDSEKESGMFATLVVQLPSKYSGGQLVVKHDGKMQKIDFSSTADSRKDFSTFFSVFYCDCEHEILPVTDGVRVCLIYNLVAKEISSTIPVAPCASKEERKLATLFQSWSVCEPPLLVYVLSHQYSEMNISFANLKSTDKAVASLLKYLSAEYSLSLYLGLLKKQSNGMTYREDCVDSDSDSDDEVSNEYYHLTKLRCIKNNTYLELYRELTIDFEEEVIPIDCFEDIQRYNTKYMPTGNEGIEVTKFYRTAALVIWPEKNLTRVLSKG